MKNINAVIASASTASANKVGIISNMSARTMAVYREINRRYENNGIDLPEIDKPKFKGDNYGDFDGDCIVNISARSSRFVPFLTKNVFGYISNELTRMHEASRLNNTGID